MNLFYAILFLMAGLVLLWKAADVLVSGAVSLANRLGVSPLIIGLTIVAMGTSAPEVAASIAAVLKSTGEVLAGGTGDAALGNVYGSNIANLALVGGLCAMIRPIAVRNTILKREMPVMIGAALLLWPVLRDLKVSMLEAGILLALFAALIITTVVQSKKCSKSKDHIHEELKDEVHKAGKVKSKPVWLSVAMIVGGLIGLTVGAKLTVDGAVYIGAKAGMSKAVIGLTIIAVGTSLPELATSLVAALKKHDDISMGNLIGSNIFNTLLVTGTAGTVKPFDISQRLLGGDYWIMIVVSCVFFGIALLQQKISRISGVILFGGYVGFIVYTLMFST